MKYVLTMLVLAWAVALATGSAADDTKEQDASKGWRVISPGSDDVLLGETKFGFEIDNQEVAISRVDVYVGGQLIGTAVPPLWAFSWEAPASVSSEQCLAVAYAGDDVVGKRRIPTRSLAVGETVGVDWVQLFPLVIDRRGRYVHDLQAGDLTVLDNGVAVDTFDFATRSVASTVALLLDASESMADRLVIVQEAADRFLRGLNERDHEIALYSFNHTLTRLASTEDPPTLARQRIRDLRATGSTALFDSLASVVGDLSEIRGRRAIVVFTDGRDERSMTSLSIVEQEARTHGVMLYVIGTIDGRHGQQDDERRELQRLADDSGGTAKFIRKIQDLGGWFDTILADLEAQYVIAYPVPKGAKGLRRVELRARNPAYRVRVRQAYWAD